MYVKMAGFIHQYFRERVHRRNRVFRERFNPLQQLDNAELYSRYRFRRADILRIVDLLRNDLEFGIRRRDTLSAEMQVLVALRFYASGSFQNVVGDTVNVHKSTVSRIVYRVSAALCRHARDFIYFPNQAQANRQKRQFLVKNNFPNVIGCIDGTQIKIQAPTENENEFVNRRGNHSINVQIVCDSDLRIINCVVRNPGSVHDARMLRESSVWRDFERQPPLLDGLILGDSAYPLRQWLMTPFLNPQTRQERQYNAAFVSTRSTVERCIGVLKRRFHCLHSELRYTPNRACRIITACLVLHNMAVDLGAPMDYEEDSGNDDDNDNEYEMEPARAGRAARQTIVAWF